MCEAFGPIIDWKVEGFEKGSAPASVVACTDSAEFVCLRSGHRQRKEFQLLLVLRLLDPPDKYIVPVSAAFVLHLFCSHLACQSKEFQLLLVSGRRFEEELGR